MKNHQLKLLWVGVALFILLLGWSGTARGEGMEGSSYIGFLAFPEEIGSFENYRHFYLSGGMCLERRNDHFGAELNFLSSFTYDEMEDRYNSSLPVQFSFNLILYPLSRQSFSPYVKAGAGGSLAWLELSDFSKTGDYAFWNRTIGAGFKFYLDSGDFFFFDYTRCWLYGNHEMDDFEVSSRSIGYGGKF
jgi:hypothetical protein